MHFKIFIIIYLFCVAYTQAQQPDSLSQQEIHKELEAIKQFRQKDSVRIAMLLNEIQLLINNEKNTPSITNSSTTNEKEIEKLFHKTILQRPYFSGYRLLFSTLSALFRTSAGQTF